MQRAMFMFIREGVLLQTISIYDIDEANQQLIFVATEKSDMNSLESDLIRYSNTYNADFINVLNDKEFESYLSETYGYQIWEDLF